jgi:hypothetical protein
MGVIVRNTFLKSLHIGDRRDTGLDQSIRRGFEPLLRWEATVVSTACGRSRTAAAKDVGSSTGFVRRYQGVLCRFVRRRQRTRCWILDRSFRSTRNRIHHSGRCSHHAPCTPFTGAKNNYIVACTTARELVVEFVAIGCTRAFGCPAPLTGLKKPPKLIQCPLSEYVGAAGADSTEPICSVRLREGRWPHWGRPGPIHVEASRTFSKPPITVLIEIPEIQFHSHRCVYVYIGDIGIDERNGAPDY